MMTSLIHALQSLSFTVCTLLVPAVLALVVFMLPWIRKKCGIETSSDMADSASEGFSAIALFFVFIAASSLSTVQGFQKDGLKVTEQEVAQITNFDRELVHAGGEKAEAARAALKNYVSEIINKEWKTMEEGKSSKDVDAALGKIISILNHMEPKGKLTEKSIDALIARLEHVSDIRDERIEVSNLHLSEIYWDIILCFVLMLLVIAFFTMMEFFLPTNVKFQCDYTEYFGAQYTLGDCLPDEDAIKTTKKIRMEVQKYCSDWVLSNNVGGKSAKVKKARVGPY
jgi:hypothetical protein